MHLNCLGTLSKAQNASLFSHPEFPPGHGVAVGSAAEADGLIFVELERQATFPLLRSNFSSRRCLQRAAGRSACRCRSSQRRRGPWPDGARPRASAIGPAQAAPASSGRAAGHKVRGASQGGSSPLAAQVGPGKMPLGLRRKKKLNTKETSRLVEGEHTGAAVRSLPSPPAPTRRLAFHAQLAHGSATGRVENFSSIQELYAKIAGVFEIPASEVSAGRWSSASPTPAAQV